MKTKTDESTCIVCGVKINPGQRGLCTTDYARFRRAKEALEPEKREAFEEMLVSRGLLLPSRQGGRIDDVFHQALAEFRGPEFESMDVSGSNTTESVVDRVAAEGIEARKKAEESGNKPKVKKIKKS